MSHARCIGIVHDEVEVRNVAEIPFTLGLDGHNPLAVENLAATVAVSYTQLYLNSFMGSLISARTR